MIILRTPKGWTGPHDVDGQPVEGTFRSHQVPMGDMDKPEHIRILETWMKSYRPQELFDETGKLKAELAELAPRGQRRMSANPHANGGLLLRDLRMPDFEAYAVAVPKPGAVDAEACRVQGAFIRDVMKLNDAVRQLPRLQPRRDVFQPLGAVFEVSDRCSTARILPIDDHVAPDGRVMEMLSEHQCQGWLEGYLLTGRHGFFSCYEAFIHIIDSMFNQHAKWLKVTRGIPWRRPIASLNYLLSSLVWRQDHNGFSHQDPGFIDHVVNKKAEVIRVYLPPDANTLLSVTDHCLRSRNYVNVIVAGKQLAPQWLSMDEAVKHCTAGIGIWEWASNDRGGEPDVVMACCGDVPTLETLAAVELLRQHIPEIQIRVINVVDLMKLQPASEHPHGLSDKDFDVLFTTDKPVIFAFHGYPSLIHRLCLSPHEPQEPARPRLQGRRDDDHALRHGGAQRPRPFPPGGRRDRPPARAGVPCGLRQAGDPRQADRAPPLHHGPRRRPARDPRLAMGAEGHGSRAAHVHRRRQPMTDGRVAQTKARGNVCHWLCQCLCPILFQPTHQTVDFFAQCRHGRLQGRVAGSAASEYQPDRAEKACENRHRKDHQCCAKRHRYRMGFEVRLEGAKANADVRHLWAQGDMCLIVDGSFGRAGSCRSIRSRRGHGRRERLHGEINTRCNAT